MTKGRRSFSPTPLDAWQMPREEPHRHLHKLERALHLHAKFRRRLQLVVGDEGKCHASTSEVLVESDFERIGRRGGGCHEDATVAIRLQEGDFANQKQLRCRNAAFMLLCLTVIG